MKTTKRILSLSLALLLMMALSPALTNAANAVASNVADGNTLYRVCSASGTGDAVLSANITMNGQLDIRRDMAIDLNGYTLNIEIRDPVEALALGLV